MTVRELIDELSKLVDSNSKIASFVVVSEGCDCIGDVVSIEVELNYDPPRILLRRYS